MNTLPDAPWIREAELYGPDDEPETIYCPICGAEDPEDFQLDSAGDVVGCECCLKKVDAYQYMMDKKQGVRRIYR